MFSEYASKFLSQSQSASRLSLGQPESPFAQPRSDRQRPSSRTRPSGSYFQRRNMNPYNSQAMSRYPFASRTSNAPAPLFYSATDDFREEDDHAEHDREMADHYALRRSRAQFGASNLSESAGTDDDMERKSDHTADGGSVEGDATYGLGRGIKSSWKDDIPTRGRSTTVTKLDHDKRDSSVPLSESSAAPSSHNNAKLVDVELASTNRGSLEDDEASEISRDVDRPPSYQQFRNPPRRTRGRSPLRTQLPIPQETDEDTLLQHPGPPDSDSNPQLVIAEPVVQPRHNFFWAEMFLLAKCALVGVIFLAWLQDSPPDKKHPLGDTIYTVLHSSFHLIGVYSLVSVLVGLLWLSLLRSFARPLVIVLLVAVPVISFSFFLYPLISSFKGSWHGKSTQDKVMRWLSVGPAIFCVGWLYTVVKGRHALDKATRMLEFSGEILQANFHLLFIGIATLAAVVVWSWIWVFMFTGLFLGGHSTKSGWVIDMSTWWLGAAFFFDYFWTLSVIAGVQRVSTAATVSHWYFHRNTNPTPPRAMVQASLFHAFYTMAGTICFSTFLSLLVRLPLLALPRRVTRWISACVYHVLPTSIAVLTNPLTLTYASIHSVPLAQASRGISEMTFISPSSPSTTLGPRSFAPSQPRPSIVSYRLSKTLLHAIRWVITLALGFGGWVSTARMLKLGNDTVPYTGSLYAYVVGLISAAIGWGALGAMEGVLGGILDAVLICWGSEVGRDGSGDARFCIEAGRLFGNEVSGQGRGRYEV
ncbi:hypothetical protein SLS60_006328 [Paraconiothyrium brasiliense]|uniref:Protein PNS1 n=1 Tax=Paraconiothyrium brasiliense TaxID=300254 RepID=A0ABR3RAE9_9PLEO